MKRGLLGTVRNGHLYLAQQTAVVRYPPQAGELKPSGPAEVLATLPEQSGHTEKGLAFDGKGRMYVNVGARRMPVRKRIGPPDRRVRILVLCSKGTAASGDSTRTISPTWSRGRSGG